MFLNNDSVIVRFPSLLPGSGRPRSPAFYRYYESAKTSARASPAAPLVTLSPDDPGLAGEFAPEGEPAALLQAWMCLDRLHPSGVCPKDACGSPMFPGNPLCSCRALRPRSDLGALPLTALRCGPRRSDSEGSNYIRISRLNHTASALAVYASCRHCWRLRKTRFRMVASLSRVGLITHRVPLSSFHHCASPAPGLSMARQASEFWG